MKEGSYYLYTDGAARGNPGPASWAYVLTKDDKVMYEDCGVIGVATNNVAEYNAIINGLKMAREYGIVTLTVVSDSQLAINQLNGDWRVKKTHLKNLFLKVKGIVSSFDKVTFLHKPRETAFIMEADRLANMALDENVH